MRRGLSVRRSRAAAWARLIGALSLPVLVIDALGRRAGIIPDEAVLAVAGLGFALAAVALVLAAYALVDIWRSGAEGAGIAAAAVFYALPALLLLGAVAAAAVIYPPLHDITTDPDDPPAVGGTVAPPGPVDVEKQAEAYPDLSPRLYELPIGEVYAAVGKLVKNRGWSVTVDEPPPSAPKPASPETPAQPAPEEAAESEDLSHKGEMVQSRKEAVRKVVQPEPELTPPPPPPPPETGSIHAVAFTPLLRFPDDVVVRLEESPEGTRVDMRSVSRMGMHDLGQNARRIKAFLADLDLALQLVPAPGAPPAATAAVSASPASSVSPAEGESE
jgi:hypothetical protein